MAQHKHTHEKHGNALLLFGIPAAVLALGLAGGLTFGANVPILWAWLASINLITFLWFGLDKHRAQKNGLRAPENLLFFLTLTGGTVGALVGMRLFRHKRAKRSFVLVIWLLIVFQAAAITLVILSSQGKLG